MAQWRPEGWILQRQVEQQDEEGGNMLKFLLFSLFLRMSDMGSYPAIGVTVIALLNLTEGGRYTAVTRKGQNPQIAPRVFFVLHVAHSTGVEPVACPLGGGRSIHLSYECSGRFCAA